MSTMIRQPGADAGDAHSLRATSQINSRAWWFLGMLVSLRNPTSAPRTPAVMELTIPPGGASPLHVHARLDDSFYVLDGEMVIRCGDDMLVGRAGDFMSLPHGVPYTFFVTSRAPVRLLLVHALDNFLALVEAGGTPAAELRLPAAGEFNADIETIMRLCTEHDTPVVGPPLGEDEARAFLKHKSGE